MEKRTFRKTGLILALLFSFSMWHCLAINNNRGAGNIQLSNTQAQKDSINPVEVFEQVWKLLNSNYPYFEQRGIDWNALHKVYSAKISPNSTDEELFNTLCDMLEHFNDGHINLDNGKKKFCSAIGVNKTMEDFSWKLVRDKYLKGSFKSSPDSMIYYSWISDDIAYMRIRRFPTKEVVEKYIDSIIQELINARGIIIDVRGNSGGNGFGVAAIGSRFADRKRLYLKNINRVGQSKEYTNATYHQIEPLGKVQYKGPVMLLQNKYSESGSEAFALALRVLPNATSVGEMTGGCFATYYPENLVNGWSLTMPWSYAVDQNDFCWEGIGVPPDLRKANTKEDIDVGNDKVLDLAIDVLKIGGHYRKEAKGSLDDLRISLVDQFITTAGSKDIKSAIAQFEESQKKNPDGVYFSIQELNVNIRELLRVEKNEEALALLELGLKTFPDDISSLYFLARMYENVQKQPEKAKPLWEKIAALSPSFPWERNLVAEAQKSLGKSK
jgi:tetratricopeptide (TPR) repeat protein